MTQPLYRVEEEVTTGWELVDPSAQGLNKMQAARLFEQYVAQGYNPNTLRIVPDTTNGISTSGT